MSDRWLIRLLLAALATAVALTVTVVVVVIVRFHDLTGWHGWKWQGWAALAALATVILAVATALLAASTRRLAAASKAEVSALSRPLVVVTEVLLGERWVTFKLKNLGPGVAIGTEVRQPEHVGGVGDDVEFLPLTLGSGEEKTYALFADVGWKFTLLERSTVAVVVDCQDVAGTTYSTLAQCRSSPVTEAHQISTFEWADSLVIDSQRPVSEYTARINPSLLGIVVPAAPTVYRECAIPWAAPSPPLTRRPVADSSWATCHPGASRRPAAAPCQSPWLAHRAAPGVG